MVVLDKDILFINEAEDVRIIDTPQWFIVQVYILFDNSYNYDQSYQWVDVKHFKFLSDAKATYQTECDKHSKL